MWGNLVLCSQTENKPDVIGIKKKIFLWNKCSEFCLKSKPR